MWARACSLGVRFHRRWRMIDDGWSSLVARFKLASIWREKRKNERKEKFPALSATPSCFRLLCLPSRPVRTCIPRAKANGEGGWEWRFTVDHGVGRSSRPPQLLFLRNKIRAAGAWGQAIPFYIWESTRIFDKEEGRRSLFTKAPLVTVSVSFPFWFAPSSRIAFVNHLWHARACARACVYTVVAYMYMWKYDNRINQSTYHDRRAWVSRRGQWFDPSRDKWNDRTCNQREINERSNGGDASGDRESIRVYRKQHASSRSRRVGTETNVWGQTTSSSVV